MVTIAALIDAPGLGQMVIQALQTLDVGTAFNAGLAIVVMAIILDRVPPRRPVSGLEVDASKFLGPDRFRRPGIVIGAVVTVIAIWLSHTYLWAAIFPSSLQIGSAHIGLDVGTHIIDVANSATEWLQATWPR